MGIGYENAWLLAQTFAKGACGGSLLQLGRQSVNLPPRVFLELLLAFGFARHEGGRVVFTHDLQDLLAANACFRLDLEPGNPAEGFLNDKLFFRALGAEAFSCDISDYENADYVADLNTDVTERIPRQFDIVYNGGTIEHVFDAAMAMRNVHALLRPGGLAIHVVPVSGYVNHGYYQISPVMLRDFHAANGYEILAAKHIVRTGRGNLVCECLNWDAPPLEANQTLLYFVARKAGAESAARTPQQPLYPPAVDLYAFAAQRHDALLQAAARGPAPGRVAGWGAGGYARRFLAGHPRHAASLLFLVDPEGSGGAGGAGGLPVLTVAECRRRAGEFDAVIVLEEDGMAQRRVIAAHPELAGKTLLV